MASGKSTIGRLLAQKLNILFIDLDDYIEEKEKMSITDIFKHKGEIYFRKQEHVYLKELLLKNNNFILSLGGGTPCYANNMDLIKSSPQVTSVYLKTSISTITSRLEAEKAKRPLVAELSKDELAEFIAKHLFERSYFYHQAHITVHLDVNDVNEAVALLESKLA